MIEMMFLNSCYQAEESYSHKGLAQTALVIIWGLLISVGLLLGSAITSYADQPSLPEQASPAAIEIIQAGSEQGYPPFCVVTDGNQADGFSVELLRAALQAMNRKVTFKTGPWNEVKQDLAEGRIQALPLVGKTPEREALYDFTFPYLKLHGAILVREDETDIRSFEDLQGKQIAVMGGDNAEEFLRRSDLDATIITTATFEDALRELAQGRHDAVVIQKLLSLQLQKKFNLHNIKAVGPPLEEFVQSFCFAVRAGDHELLSLLNEGLALVIADGTFNRLRAKWFGPLEGFNYRYKRIVVGGDSAYPPYEYLDDYGQPAGYNVDLTRAIAKQLGIEVDIRLGPWSEIRQELDEGKIDIVQGMFYSAEREAQYDFSPGHSVVNHVAVARTETTMPHNLSDLAGQSIAVMAGDIMHDLAVHHGFDSQLTLATSQEEALHMVAEGKVDLALVAQLPALYWIKKHQWRNLHVAEQSFLSPDYCYAAPHSQHRLTSLFSEGLANVKSTGLYRQIYVKWLGVYEEPRIGWRDILKFSLFTTVPILLLLAGALLWSRALSRQVDSKTAELQEEVAERRRREEEVSEKNAELDQKNAELERFTYTVSHDLKSPLVTLRSFLGFIEKDIQAKNQEKIAKDLVFMHGAIDKMNNLLKDLLRFSQVGWQVVPPESLSFCAVVSEALSLLAGPIRKAGTQVRVTEEPIQLCGDRTRLIQIWQNLIENAVKYRCPDATWPKNIPLVEIGVETTAKETVFFVRDNGIGIDPRFQNKIFGLFNQLDPKAEGSGVGLALVVRIIELYGGKIWVESKGCGHGTCFRFTLPGALNSSTEDPNSPSSVTP